MRSQTARKLIGALILGAATFAVAMPAHAAGLTITNPDLAEPVQEAQEAAANNDYEAAIAAMHRAEGVDGISAAERAFIHQSILAYATQGRQYQTALQMVESMIANNEGNRNGNLRAALQLSLLLNQTQKAQQYANQLGETGNMAIYLAQAQLQSGNAQQAIQTAMPLVRGVARPSRDVLNLLGAAYAELDDNDGRLSIAEQLVLHYPTMQTWDNVIRLTRVINRFSDEQELELMRLRMLTGNLTVPTDYSEAAQLALIAGYPGDAKVILDKAAEEDMLEAEAGRGQRLVATVEQRIPGNQAEANTLAQQAASDPSGDSDLKLGLILFSYGRNDAAETSIRQAIEKGMLSDPEAAKIALGRVLLAKDEQQEAVNTFNSVSADDASWSAIARLWSIYARQS